MLYSLANILYICRALFARLYLLKFISLTFNRCLISLTMNDDSDRDNGNLLPLLIRKLLMNVKILNN